MNELALFAGAGGGLLASLLLGWTTIGAVEIEPYPRNILLQRQREGFLERFPIWDDIRTFDGKPWRGLVDVLSGGFPCQDISAAGKGAGLAGSRSGLWFEYLRVIEESRPRFVFAENSTLLRTRGLGTVLEGLAALGYDARWCVLGARHLGYLHGRDRMWIVACDRGQIGLQRHSEEQIQRIKKLSWRDDVREFADLLRRSPIHSPFLCGGNDGVADRVDRTKAVGNGQVPLVAATAWRILSEGLV